jgi:hypothetical protein
MMDSCAVRVAMLHFRREGGRRFDISQVKPVRGATDFLLEISWWKSKRARSGGACGELCNNFFELLSCVRGLTVELNVTNYLV